MSLFFRCADCGEITPTDDEYAVCGNCGGSNLYEVGMCPVCGEAVEGYSGEHMCEDCLDKYLTYEHCKQYAEDCGQYDSVEMSIPGLVYDMLGGSDGIMSVLQRKADDTAAMLAEWKPDELRRTLKGYVSVDQSIFNEWAIEQEQKERTA